jgi:hypothetical protein
MFAVMILVIAIVALFQFAIYYWRAVLTGVASMPVSSQVLEAAHAGDGELRGADFGRLASLYDLTPELQGGGSGLGLVRLYFAVVRKAGQLSPAFLNWGEREMALCARYAAVQIDRRLQGNLEQAASVRSC